MCVEVQEDVVSDVNFQQVELVLGGVRVSEEGVQTGEDLRDMGMGFCLDMCRDHGRLLGAHIGGGKRLSMKTVGRGRWDSFWR